MADASDFEIIKDIDENPKQVISFNFNTPLEVFEKSYRHSHRKAQLLYVKSGVLNCEVDNAIWLVPTQSAVWIPSYLPHCVFGVGAVECISVYFEPGQQGVFPENCSTIAVNGLLRELISASVLFEHNRDYNQYDKNIIAVLIDQIGQAEEENLFLPMPKDAKLQDLIDILIQDPSNKETLSTLARKIGMSERTLVRKLSEQTGMSFGQWKRQLHIITAIKKLSLGLSVKSVAYELGYESSSSFVTMFKKFLGKSPLKYIRDNH